MRVLLDRTGVDGEEIGEDAVLAAYPWPQDPDGTPWVRAMMVTTLDGAAAGPDGLSGSISSAADEAVFTAVRRLADAVLIGSGTMRSERYGPMVADPADAERRSADGLAAAPRLVVVSGSLGLPWDEPVWTGSSLQPLVLTTAEADPAALARAREHVEVAALPDLDPQTVLDALTERGLLRVVCEGGPTLLRDFVEADLVDEADITVSPAFAGTGHTPETPSLPSVSHFRLVHVLTGDDCLMVRYLGPGR